MRAWLPFSLLTIFIWGLAVHQWQQATDGWTRFKRLGLLGFIWILTAFCYTPTSYNFSGDVILHYIQWGPVKLNPVPFQQLDTEFWLNVLLTVPLGGLLAWNFPNWSWRRRIAVGLLTGLTLEGGQFLFDLLAHVDRWVETDDVLTNWSGVLIGSGAYFLFRRIPGLRWLQK
ncbi:VanZ family protein [Lactiplantibacillus modestisalitolerans]|uniref:VanZ family protein n=1 Tax=Lactiplantibacillus modestisalitolerans TaxID=1457219 RepID=A0ABV5WRZ0_9LACO|nr:VanZ family protein [Lactiplantibacillus modestisalitolerans]